MIDFEKELASILEHDPLGLLIVKPKTPSALTADARLIASFEEINAFVSEHGHEPTKSRSNIGERKLHSRLKGLRDSSEKASALRKYDIHKLLADVPTLDSIETIDDILNDDVLGLLDDDPLDIFTLRNVPDPKDSPDYIAKRKPCKDFELFEPLFKQAHVELATKQRVTVPFEGERQIEKGSFFILQGMLVYVANMGEWKKRNFHNVDARMYLIFENGTESNMLLRSLAGALWRDKNSRHVVDALQMELLTTKPEVSEEDAATGYIYILRSLSNNPQIRETKDLYKIGFSTQPTAQRIQNAAQEPTYLMARVIVVAEYQTFNLNPQKLELLLHKFFAEACLNLDVFDNEGKRHMPREWFVVPLNEIELAIKLLLSGDIVNYRYDYQQQEIVGK